MIERIKAWFCGMPMGGKIFVIAAAVIIAVSIIQEVIGG